MSKIKIGFSKLSVTNQVERSRKIQTNMTGNLNFPTPAPALLAVKAATDAVETAYNESRGKDKNKIQILKLRRAEMLVLIVQLAAYVQSASNGDKEIILSSGFDVIERGLPQPPVGQVMNVRLSDGNVSGKLKVAFDKTAGAKVYVIEICPDPLVEANWDAKGASTKTRFELINLTPGTKYWVRVAAIGKDGIGLWSYPAFKIAE